MLMISIYEDLQEARKKVLGVTTSWAVKDQGIFSIPREQSVMQRGEKIHLRYQQYIHKITK